MVRQIGVYNPGGLYVPHTDSFTALGDAAFAHNGDWIGNRIATCMIYVRKYASVWSGIPWVCLVGY